MSRSPSLPTGPHFAPHHPFMSNTFPTRLDTRLPSGDRRLQLLRQESALGVLLRAPRECYVMVPLADFLIRDAKVDDMSFNHLCR